MAQVDAIGVRVGVRLFGAVTGLFALTLFVEWLSGYLRPKTQVWLITPYATELSFEERAIDLALLVAQLVLPVLMLVVAAACIAFSHRVVRLLTPKERLS